MRRLVTATAIAALAAASVVSTAGGSPAPATARHLSGRQWLAQQRERAQASGGTVIGSAKAGSAGTYDLEQFAALVPAGKLKGSTPDLFDIRRTALPTVASSDGVTARVGSTGRALWHRTVPQPAGGFVAIYPMVVGAPARRGVLVETSSQTTQSGQTDFSETLTAYAGSNGHLLWTQTFTGDQPANGDMSTVPSYVGALAQPHGAPVQLIAEDSSSGSADSAQLVEISGSSGSFTQLGDPVTATDTFADFTALPDANRDGVADVAALVSTLSAPYASLLSGATGQALWTVKGADPIAIESIGHFSSTRHIDLALSVDTKSGKDEIIILAAATGQPVLVRVADEINVIRKAGKHLQPAVQLLRLSAPLTSKKVSSVVDSLAVTPSNRVLYNKRVSVSEAPLPGQKETEAPITDGVAGDVQGDGSLDELLSFSAESTSATKDRTTTKTGIVDGRTGVFRELNAVLASDGSLHKGSHTDFLADTVKAGRLRLSAWHGSTRKPYFLGKIIGGVTGIKAAWLGAARVSGHSCSDVLLSAASPNAGVLGVIDGAGRLLWVVKHTAGQATGGKVKVFSKPKHFCS
jgi:hypothetical protein